MPRRKPTQVKKLAGTLRRDRMNIHEPRPPAANVRCPPGMPRGAKKWWRKLAPTLADLGLLTVLDLPAARDMCVCFGRLEEAEREVTERGIVVTGYRGGLVRNPAVSAANQYRAGAYRWAARFGLTPSDRAAPLAVTPDGDGNQTLADMLFEKAQTKLDDRRDDETE